MAFFVVKTKHSAKIKEWIGSTKTKNNNSNPFKAPFKISLNYFKAPGEISSFIACLIEPIFPNVSVFGWAGVCLIYSVWGYSNFILLPITIGLSGFFWSSTFYSFIVSKSLKRFGHTHSVKRVKVRTLFEEVIFNRSN